MGPGDLARALEKLELIADPNVLVGLERPDDAGVYLLSKDVALVQTIDFFTPVVDDPRTFGRIAATNALSDVYAMGGRPISALNVVCFPRNELDLDVLSEILAGGLDALREASCPLIGGHSVDDPELKYGLSITGVVDPRAIVTSAGALAGDTIVLTKPIGTGVIGTAEKRERAPATARAAAVLSMTTSNRAASEAMLRHEVHAATDVTGFGLLGHARDLVAGAELDLVLRAADVPLLPDVLELARDGMLSGGLSRNRAYFAPFVDIGDGLAPELIDVLWDPQTSGGLLVALPAARAGAYLDAIGGDESLPAAAIGEIVTGKGRVRVGG